MAKNITLLGADYPDVPAVQLPQTGGGTATFYDIAVIDNLTSTSATDALSANQGRVLNNKLCLNIGSKTLSGLETQLDTMAASMADGDMQHFMVYISASSGVFTATSYVGFLERTSSTRFYATLSQSGQTTVIHGAKGSSGWMWERIAESSLFDDTQANDVNALMLAKYNLVKNKGTGTYLIAGGWNGVQYGFSIVSIIDSSNAIVVFHGNADSWRCKIENNAVINLQQLALKSDLSKFKTKQVTVANGTQVINTFLTDEIILGGNTSNSKYYASFYKNKNNGYVYLQAMNEKQDATVDSDVTFTVLYYTP